MPIPVSRTENATGTPTSARAERLRLAPQRLHEPIAIEPAFAAFSERARREVFGVQPREAHLQLRGIEQADVRERVAADRGDVRGLAFLERADLVRQTGEVG